MRTAAEERYNEVIEARIEAENYIWHAMDYMTTAQLQHLSAFIKARYFDEGEKLPFEGLFVTECKNLVRAEVSNCDDSSLLDFVWRVLVKSSQK